MVGKTKKENTILRILDVVSAIGLTLIAFITIFAALISGTIGMLLISIPVIGSAFGNVTTNIIGTLLLITFGYGLLCLARFLAGSSRSFSVILPDNICKPLGQISAIIFALFAFVMGIPLVLLGAIPMFISWIIGLYVLLRTFTR